MKTKLFIILSVLIGCEQKQYVPRYWHKQQELYPELKHLKDIRMWADEVTHDKIDYSEYNKAKDDEIIMVINKNKDTIRYVVIVGKKEDTIVRMIMGKKPIRHNSSPSITERYLKYRLNPFKVGPWWMN
jgi:hypothetical protein